MPASHRPPVRRPRPTLHSTERARERFGIPRRHAEAYVAAAFDRSCKLPWRFAARLLRRAPTRVKGHADARVAGAMLLVTRGRTVITVWELSVEELATVLVWRLFGVWIGEEE